jgi:hypothetical protein
VFHLRDKRTGETTRISMPSNSAVLFDTTTNALYTHGVPRDKRDASQLRADERLFDTARISIVWRNIATFQCQRGLWGQGARCKSFAQLNDRRNNENDNDDNNNDDGRHDAAETQRLLAAFRAENNAADDFDWHHTYATGFDVLSFEHLPAQ